MVPHKIGMPAQASIQSFASLLKFLDSGLRGMTKIEPLRLSEVHQN
jgi:hypothetical protein